MTTPSSRRAACAGHIEQTISMIALVAFRRRISSSFIFGIIIVVLIVTILQLLPRDAYAPVWWTTGSASLTQLHQTACDESAQTQLRLQQWMFFEAVLSLDSETFTSNLVANRGDAIFSQTNLRQKLKAASVVKFDFAPD
jgi:hypothetical protein